VLPLSEPCPLGFGVLWTGHHEIGSDVSPAQFAPPSNPRATLPTPLATHSPYTPSVRVPACESGHARANGGGADEASSPVADVWAGEEL